jgi:structural maintenance of chromosome 2
VVSLKEGMFNNANVIFRTKFVDGVSTVTRTVNDSAAIGQGENTGRAAAGKAGSKGAASRGALRESNRA